MILFKKEKEVIELIEKHVDKVEECISNALTTIQAYLDGDITNAKKFARQSELLENGLSIYPNPASKETNIEYTIYSIQYTILSIHDAFGRIVEALVDEEQQAGEYKVKWNVENVSPGVYFYKLTSGGELESGKIIIR